MIFQGSGLPLNLRVVTVILSHFDIFVRSSLGHSAYDSGFSDHSALFLPSRMAKEGEKPTASEKGKAKTEDAKELNGEKADDSLDKRKDKLPTGKDGLPTTNGKVGDLPQDELSEEDQQLKSELEMLVERLQEPDTTLYKPAIDAIKEFIKTSTSSMTAVPKPLKFLRPHYDELTALYEKWPAGSDRDSLADMLSVLGMTYGDEDKLETLKYRLLSKSDDLGSWGHEYIRHLALELGQEYQNRLTDEREVQDLVELALALVPYFLSHNAEADAVDLLSELEMIEEIPRFLDENNFGRVCLYMVSMVNLLTFPEDHQFLKTAHDVYMKYNKIAQAMVLAIRLNDIELVRQDFHSTEDAALRKQLAFLIARQQIWLDAARNPGRAWATYSDFVQQYTQVMTSTALKFWGREEGAAKPVIEAEKGDKRFSAPDWQQGRDGLLPKPDAEEPARRGVTRYWKRHRVEAWINSRRGSASSPGRPKRDATASVKGRRNDQ